MKLSNNNLPHFTRPYPSTILTQHLDKQVVRHQVRASTGTFKRDRAHLPAPILIGNLTLQHSLNELSLMRVEHFGRRHYDRHRKLKILPLKKCRKLMDHRCIPIQELRTKSRETLIVGEQFVIGKIK